MLIICIIVMFSPIIIRVIRRKSKIGLLVIAVVTAAVLLISNFSSQLLNFADKSTEKLFNGAEVSSSSVDGVDYSKYVIKSDKNIKNVLICGTDKRPGNTDDTMRTDIMMLVSIDKDTDNIYCYSLSRDTHVRRDAVSDDICKLNEVAAYGGGMSALINCIRFNFGIDINEYILVNWYAMVDFVDVFFPEGIDYKLTELEMIGINQVLPEQNTCFGRGRLDDLLSDPITGKKEFGLEEIGYLDSIGEEEHLYDINNLIEGTKYTRRFDDTIDHTVRLNGAQALAFNRARHCYENQAQSRDQKVLSFMMSIGSSALDVLTEEKLDEFTERCLKHNSFETSYSDIKEVLADLTGRSLNMGKAMHFDNGKTELVTCLPIVYSNNYGNAVLNYNYESLRNQAQKLIYE